MGINPKLNGYTLRPVVLGDAAAITDLCNTCAVALNGAPEVTEQYVRTDLETPGFDPHTDTVAIVTPQDEMVGYAEFWNISEPRVRAYFFGRVHPDHQKHGLGSTLFDWAKKRSVRLVDEAPEGARVSLRCSASARNQAALALFERQGFVNDRTFFRMVIEMDAPPPAPQWPDGIRVRTLTPTRENHHQVFQASEDAFQDHWGHLPLGFDKWLHWVENDEDFDPSLWFLAFDGDEIAGICLCSPKTAEDPGMGWVGSLAVRRPWRRRGIALALLHHCFGAFWQRGTRKVGLGVDAASLTGATRLYEKAGMHVTREFRGFELELRPGEELSTQTLDT